MCRARHEHQIKLLDSTFGREAEKAIDTLVRRHGLDWFTDEQIADIRDEMIGRCWFHHKFTRANRKLMRA